MSLLSGYDSEVTGFDRVPRDRRSEACSSTQTTEFAECGAASQTTGSRDVGCTALAADLRAQEDVLRESPPPGLNEFLRRVVPAVMEQLEQNDRELACNSSDSEDEETITAKLLQEIKLKSDGVGAGDHHTSILAITWSGAGNSFAVSVGQAQHDAWCETPGLIQVFMLRRSEGDKFVHEMDIAEKNCVTALKYHPTVAALLAYGTTSGEVVLCDLRHGTLEEGTQLASPAACHGARRVSALRWADSRLANVFLLMQIRNKGRRRGASDQVLISAGGDGTLNVWQVNANSKVFENIVSYSISGSRRAPAPVLSCFDFARRAPPGELEEGAPNGNVFVAGATSGDLFLCKITDDDDSDPVHETLEGHSSCVLDVAFSPQKPGIFVSLSMDSELRVYDVQQAGPLRVVCLDGGASCVAWLRPPCVAVGLAGAGGVGAGEREAVRVYDASSGRALAAAGLGGAGGAGGAGVSCLSVSRGGTRVAAAGAGAVRVWALSPRRGARADSPL